MTNYSNIFRLSIKKDYELIGNKEEIKQYEEFINNILYKHCEEQKLLEKIVTSYALGVPLLIKDDGTVEVMNNE